MVALEYSQLHKKLSLVCEFEGFESVLRGWPGRTGHPYIASTDAMIMLNSRLKASKTLSTEPMTIQPRGYYMLTQQRVTLVRSRTSHFNEGCRISKNDRNKARSRV